MVKKVAIYARVSKDTGDQTTEVQLLQLRDYCQQRGLVYDEISEEESSGKTRPLLNQLLIDCEAGRYSTLIVWKLDRFSRSMREAVVNMMRLEKAGVRFISITQGIDTDKSDPMSRLMINLLAAFAEFEREIIRERVRAGLALAKRRGKVAGRKSIETQLSTNGSIGELKLALLNGLIREVEEGKISVRQAHKQCLHEGIKISRGALHNRISERMKVKQVRVKDHD